ncbi:hypothetical protein BCV72DRAFT_273145 [Rhizopus microsporus var. microsporus]|uniref:PPP4R2-domain-containing protein n=2 Tax=Rhizopus microsporus TaxID=58291 RepID=A0A2G4SUQ1_RHIZD|nr:uncharacterized protein RHIMIDRAFT_282306 [Rhizopus microsporus ATCC 52813]ORE07625.1 hypothetical protein BCV72DRAFT_273145 [Rhizopus microsporus var. microsporus]PHZ12508.1 hypothetical protein RHIMIDRAFT_282306 [Rhizopus microsporus ATCC 52813]
MSSPGNDSRILDSNGSSQQSNGNAVTERQSSVRQEARPDLVEIEDSFESLKSSEQQALEALEKIAETNQVMTPWSELRIILNRIVSKQSRIMDPKLQDSNVRNQADRITADISEILQKLEDCPFTIQRVCELVVNPTQHYKTYLKYLRALQKTLGVRSSWQEFVDRRRNAARERTEDDSEGFYGTVSMASTVPLSDNEETNEEANEETNDVAEQDMDRPKMNGIEGPCDEVEQNNEQEDNTIEATESREDDREDNKEDNTEDNTD